MRCPVHLSIGQEASAVGVCSALNLTDWVFSGHRNHAHYLAKGGNLKTMLAEIYGKASGCCGGKGGSMHLSDLTCGFIAATPIVGSTVPIAVGAALTAKRQGNGRVVVVFLGDGAMEAGIVHESLNFASVKKLPILFVCENNLYSVYSPLNVRQPSNRTLSQVASGHGIQVLTADGNNVEEVYLASKNAVRSLRNEIGPVFLELPTYRWLEHCGPGYDNNIGYRSEEEFEKWKLLDPVIMQEKNMGTQLDVETLLTINKEIEDAFHFATNSTSALTSDAAKHVYAVAKEVEDSYTDFKNNDNRELSYAQALLEAQDICLESYPETYLMGLGVPDPKGIFGSTLGLQEKYGSDRVFDIPLAESAMTGVALGSSITGYRPILTHQRLDFTLVSMDQIVNQAAKWHYMFDGSMNAPLVIRMIVGRGWGQGPQHSQSLHSWFAHIPGLKVVMPTTPYDAKGMLISAIEDNNPVICIEHRWLYGIRDKVPEGIYRSHLDKSRVLRAGTDLTIIGVSYMTLECIRAAEVLKDYGIRAEVIDLLSVRPIDEDTLVNSVACTGRVLIVDCADRFCGVGAEIVAFISERLFSRLLCPPARISLPNHPVPTSHFMAANYYPTSKMIILKALEMLGSKLEDKVKSIRNEIRHDQPENGLQGPF